MAKHLSVILKQYNDVISGKVPASKVMALSTGKDPGVDYAGKMPDERDFVASHSVEKFPDRNGNGDDVFNASNIKVTEPGRHGHLPNPKSVKVYQQANEEVEELDEIKKPLANYIKKRGEELKYFGDKESIRRYNKKGETVGDQLGKDVKSRSNKFIAKAKSKLGEEVEDFDEAKDEGEYGYEGDMAITQLKTIVRHSQHLMGMLKPDTDLPEWVQAKITKAEDYISTAHDYLMSEMTEENGNFEQIDEISSKLARKYGSKATRAALEAKSKGDRATANKRFAGVNMASAKAFPNQYKNSPIKAKVSATNEEVEQIDEAKCNMTEAGTMCEVHGMKGCNKEETKSASDKEPRYNGKDKKNIRQLLTDKKTLQEKAKSIAQQELMAMASAHKKGKMDNASEQVKKLAASMTEKQLSDFAKTKHTGLPKRVQKEESAAAPTPITFPVTNSREGFKL